MSDSNYLNPQFFGNARPNVSNQSDAIQPENYGISEVPQLSFHLNELQIKDPSTLPSEVKYKSNSRFDDDHH